MKDDKEKQNLDEAMVADNNSNAGDKNEESNTEILKGEEEIFE